MRYTNRPIMLNNKIEYGDIITITKKISKKEEVRIVTAMIDGKSYKAKETRKKMANGLVLWEVVG